MTRPQQGVRGQREPSFHRIEHAAATGMDRPQSDGAAIALRQKRKPFAKMPDNRTRHLSRQVHRETPGADMPGDMVGGRRQHGAAEPGDRDAERSGADHGGGAAVGEMEEREQLCQSAALLQVQAAQLDGQHQDACVLVRAHDMPGEPQCRNCSRTAHEADDRPLGRRQSELRRQLQIETRGGKAGARRDDQMGDLVGCEVEAEIRHRAACERQRFAVVARHPLRRIGKPAAAVKTFGIEPVGIGAGGEAGEAVRDLATLGHALEHLPLLPVGEQRRREFDEFAMKVVDRDGTPDPVDEGFARVLLHTTPTFRLVALRCRGNVHDPKRQLR